MISSTLTPMDDMNDTTQTEETTIMAKPPVYQHLIDSARREGYAEGVERGHKDLLDWLEFAYIGAKDRPDRGSERGEAILQVARDASTHFKALAARSRKGKRK